MATLIKGNTTHRCCGLNRAQLNKQDQEAWSDTRLLIADEISFAAKFAYEKLDSNLRYLLEKPYEQYGGLNIVFAGDFRQLEPVQGTPIYEQICLEFTDFINCYIELEGMHRFADDPDWGRRLLEFRNGSPTLETIRHINKHCVVEDPSTLPPGIQVATYYNRDRDSINAATFEHFCTGSNPSDRTSIMILMDELMMPDDSKCLKPVSDPSIKSAFWERCGEDDCYKKWNGRVDPVLKLYPGCPVMLTENTCVAGGMANGTRAHVRKVVLKTSESTTSVPIGNGQTVNAVFASQVKEVRLEHEDNSIRPQKFSVTPVKHAFTTTFPTEFGPQKASMQGLQFPFVSNTCTTGHKLQGATVDDILVNSWCYTKNWHYVVLSRVRTMKGLYLREPLSEDLSKYAKPQALDDMMQRFTNTCLATLLPDHVYNTFMEG